jgi:hypothetical protein
VNFECHDRSRPPRCNPHRRRRLFAADGEEEAGTARAVRERREAARLITFKAQGSFPQTATSTAPVWNDRLTSTPASRRPSRAAKSKVSNPFEANGESNRRDRLSRPRPTLVGLARRGICASRECTPRALPPLAFRFAVQQRDKAVRTLNVQVDAHSLKCQDDLAGVIIP